MFKRILYKILFVFYLIGSAFAVAPNWDCDGDGNFDDISIYQNSGSITSAILIEGVNISSIGDMLGAFVDGELRGLGLPTAVPFGPNQGTYQFLTLIYSNVVSGEQISFKFYDNESDVLYILSENYEFISDMTLGNVLTPEILNNFEIDSGYSICEENDCPSGLYDCEGICDGSAIEDECGICGGFGIEEWACDCEGNVDDCLGVCDGIATFDSCNVCGGDNSSCNLLVTPFVNQETGWEFFQSPSQAFYGFSSISINGIDAAGGGNWAPGETTGYCLENPGSCDVVGAFLGDVCVGWNYVDSTNITQTTLSVQGFYDGSATNQTPLGYCNSGDTPTFYIFDSSINQIYLLADESIFNPWNNLEFFISTQNLDAIQEVGGCIEPYAENFDPSAMLYDVNDDCYYLQSLNFNQGWNIFSLSLLPNSYPTSLFDVLDPLESSISLVLDELGGAIFKNQSGQWVDNIGLWEPEEGYLIKLDNPETLTLNTQELITLPFEIDLSAGWNVMSYPIQSNNGLDIEVALDDLITSQDLYGVFSETGDFYFPDYITGSSAANSIGSLSKSKGYYIKVLTDTQLIVEEPSIDVFAGNFEDVTSNISTRDNHFIPVWSGNPLSPMTITVDIASWSGTGDLVEGDEIGVFDGDLCVGSGIVGPDGSINNSTNQIKTSKDDGSSNGFTEGNLISFRVWRDNIEVDIDATVDSWVDVSGNATDQVFESLTAPRLELQVYAPSSISSINIIPGSDMMDLSWSYPNTGSYQIYNNNIASNAITFDILLNGDEDIASNLNTSNFTHTSLNYNQSYSYVVKAESVVGTSYSTIQSGLTMPGVPAVLITSGLNSNDFEWFNPEITGLDGSILYKIQRSWDVGDTTYDIILVEATSNQVYEDSSLLNSSLYSYRIKAFNTSGESPWSDFIEGTTIDGSSSILMITGITATSNQVLDFPDNIVDLTWDNVTGVDGYNIYHRNILIGSSTSSTFTHTGLRTSELMQYVITAYDGIEESLPSAITEVTTLPELDPQAPDNFEVEDGQNQISLSWDSVSGYDNIGGAAVSYNIYRITLSDYIDAFSMDLYNSSLSNDFVDYNLDDNSYYCYSVSGVNSEGAEGFLSEVICNGTLPQLPASTPGNLTATGGNQEIVLTWSASTGSPDITYQIYRSGEYIDQTSSLSFSDTGLQKNTDYLYAITATNELGSSILSESVSAQTTVESSILAAATPQNITADILDTRASEYLEEIATITWDEHIFTEQEAEEQFQLVYTGNPFQPMTLIVNDFTYLGSDIPVGSLVAIFDGQKCVGVGQTPLPGGQLTASSNDGDDNGFISGNSVYFKVWNSTTGSILTATNTEDIIFEGQGFAYLSLSVEDNIYNLYRNGSILEESIVQRIYEDAMLESEMDYNYRVSAINSLGIWSESNPSESILLTTEDYVGSAPLFTEEFEQSLQDIIIYEDTNFSISLDGAAEDANGDVINYSIAPLLEDAPVVCGIEGSQLTIIPDSNFNGTYEIILSAYDDYDAYESNTLFDTIIFDLEVAPINDAPIVLNEFSDIDFDEDLYFNQSYELLNLSEYILDVDDVIMDQDQLVFTALSSNENLILEVEDAILSFEANELIEDYGATLITITATDQSDESVLRNFTIFISEVVVCLPENDFDGDGICDGADSCPEDFANDSDNDGSCDSDDICPGLDDFLDTDEDQIVDCQDSCPLDADNDSDGDGVCGDIDICPEDLLDDSDGDGACDSDDICPGFDDFLDTDGDQIIDCLDICPQDLLDDSDEDGACDSDDICPGFDDFLDTDGDEIVDCQDTCPLDSDNDIDEDGICGDIDECPADAFNDSDGDGTCDSDDICPNFDDFLDTDGDQIVDCLDDCPQDFANDSDQDGVCGNIDICQGFDDNIDSDLDEIPDGCDICPSDFDNDIDGDNICGDIDLCPLDADNDIDGDGACGDVDECPNDAENDSDQDGVCGDVDICQGFDDNIDSDLDAIPDGCDTCPLDFVNDIDGDNICGDIDSCPLDADNDIDGDGACGDVDICPGFDDFLDTDADQLVDCLDACPLDSDNDNDEDGICGDVDICPGFNDNVDSDFDTIPDGCDTCPLDANNDIDQDGICGDLDLCPEDELNDFDGDGLCSNEDICPNDADNDIDSDGICGNFDQCPNNPENDADDDGLCEDIDICPLDADNDIDGDGACGDVDICPGFDDFLNTDNDEFVDCLDFCPFDPANDIDNDGVCGDVDECPGFDDNVDSDGDTLADGCDICPLDVDNDIDFDGLCGDVDVCPNDFDNDSDNDGICGDIDICPLDAENDVDSDGICGDIDACPNDIDNDIDNDGICGDIDICPLDIENDGDGDGLCEVVDICPYDFDNDADGDGICGDIDECPGFDDNIDSDGDMLADGCDICPFDEYNDSDGDGICLDQEVPGCTDLSGINYNLLATDDDGSCDFDPIYDQSLDNYNSTVGIDLPLIELSEVEVDIDIPAGALDIPEGTDVTLEVSEASEQELEIIIDNSTSTADVNVYQGISFEATDNNGNDIELAEGAVLAIEMTFSPLRSNYDIGYITQGGEIVALSALCSDNGDESYTCAGSGPGFGSYIVYSYNIETTILGCTQLDACNYDYLSDLNDGSCLADDDYGICGGSNDGDGTCVDSPIGQNSFTMLSTDNLNELQVLYNSTSQIIGFEYIINWCSNIWIDTDQDGIADTIEDYICPDEYVIDNSGIVEWVEVATENWTIQFENHPTYSHIIGFGYDISNDLSDNFLSSGCGILGTLNYIGNIHSIYNINWSGIGAQDLGFIYDPCENCSDALDADYPSVFTLSQNYPNPFNPNTSIDFKVTQIGFIEIKIYDIQGKYVNTLVSDYKSPGSYTVKWDAKNYSGQSIPSGIYLYQIKSINSSVSKKMVLLR